MDALLAESVDRFLAGCSTPAVVRELERTLTETPGGPKFPDSASEGRRPQGSGPLPLQRSRRDHSYP